MSAPRDEGCGLTWRRQAHMLVLYQLSIQTYDRTSGSVRDSARLLVVAEGDAEIVATFQLSFLPGLARRGRSGRRSRPSGYARTIAAVASARP